MKPKKEVKKIVYQIGYSSSYTVSHNYASASCYNITSQADKTFHVNCLNACETPLITAGPFGTGTLYKIPVTAGMAAIGFPLGGFVALVQ